MKVNDILTVKIIDVDNNGNGIVRYDNFVIFVRYALLNEELKVKIFEVNKRYAKAKIIEVITPNKLRHKIICPYFNECGGCNFLHMSYEEEKKLKEDKIKSNFNTKINSLVCEDIYNYRNKVIFHVKDKKIGFYKENTNDLVEISYCHLLDEDLNKVLKHLNNIDINFNEVLIRKSITNNEVMLSIDGNLSNKDLDYLLSNINNLVSIYTKDGLRYGSEYISEVINGITYTIGPKSFFQVNTKVMINLYDKIKEYAKKDKTLLDLYCGTGTIGIYLSDNFKKVMGVEIVKESIINAQLNKEINGIDNINFINTDASKINTNYDVVVVDPARSGLSKNVIYSLLKNKPKRIVYTSCNYKTLKRDIELLQDLYEVVEISLFDMFPRCNHVETVVCLSRQKVEEHIYFDVNIADLPKTTRTTATYPEIKAYVKEKHGLCVSSLNIAQVKEKHGFEKRPNYNKGADGHRVPQCPPDKEKAIEDAFKHFGML